MIWKHHYSLLVSAGVFVVMWVTRPDFEVWHLLPSLGLWSSGHVIIIRLGRRQRSPEIAALRDKLEMDRMREEHRRKMYSSWGDRHLGALVVLFLVVVLGGLGTVSWLGVYGTEGVREWLDLFGCRC